MFRSKTKEKEDNSFSARITTPVFVHIYVCIYLLIMIGIFYYFIY